MALKFNVIHVNMCIFAVWGKRNSPDERGRWECSCGVKAAVPVLAAHGPERHSLHGGSKTGSRLNIVTLVHDNTQRRSVSAALFSSISGVRMAYCVSPRLNLFCTSSVKQNFTKMAIHRSFHTATYWY